MRIAIGIATRGRAAILAEVLADLARQTRAPDRILVCHAGPEDVADLPARRPDVQFMTAPAGLPASATRSWTRWPIATRCCSWTTISSPRPTTSP
jgi:hypothetical protein